MTEPGQHASRVVVVDDHQLFADVVVLALKKHGFDAESVDPSDHDEWSMLVPMIVDHPPEVLLLDLDLGSYGDGSQLIEPAVRAGVAVVVMDDHDSNDDAVRALEAGARCAISKKTPLAELVDTLERLLAGDPIRS